MFQKLGASVEAHELLLFACISNFIWMHGLGQDGKSCKGKCTELGKAFSLQGEISDI